MRNHQTARPSQRIVFGTSYPVEEYICAALTTSDLPQNYEVGDDWVAGRDPDKTSYRSPWVVATIKHDAIANPQGNMIDAFTDRILTHCTNYLDTA